MAPGVAAITATATRCDCGTEVADGILACPGCHRLVHAGSLKLYREQAEAAARSGDVGAELAAWRLALALVPPQSRQSTLIFEKITALSTEVQNSPPPSSSMWRWLGSLGTAGLVLWKLKFLVVALATKGKLLLFGLTKASTIFSMLLSFGVYWTAWGMWFAMGVVLSIYVHEMGHIAALRRFGIASSAPMFIPGLGALIRLKAQRLSPREDARIGLAGPMWGLAAAGVCLLTALMGAGPMWLAIARTGAWLNAFNLLPFWQLDGNRGFAAVSRRDRAVLAAVFAAGWMIASDGLFVLLGLASVARLFNDDAPESSDMRVVVEFGCLIIALATIVRFAA
jgi:Zn-dependent protease